MMKVNMLDILNRCDNMMENESGIKVINICQFFTIIYPDFFSNFERISIRENAITNFIQKHFDKIHYYARPKEDFFIGEAIIEAKENNKKFVIVEDMS